MNKPERTFVISSLGEIESDALTLLGGSTKRSDDSTIGRFGSGNKYAIAVLLRRGIGLRIFSGESEIFISTKRKEFRGQTFNVILVNGQETSITTEAGPDYETWECVREFWANAHDEGDHYWEELTPESDIIGIPGRTCIYLINPAMTDGLAQVFDNWDRYFRSDELAIASNSGGYIFPKRGESGVFVSKMGIRVNAMRDYRGLTGLFSYQFNDIDINEMRKTSTFSVYTHIRRVWAYMDDKDRLLTLLRSWHDKTIEWHAFSNHVAYTLSDAWLELSREFGLYPEWLRKHLPNEALIVPDELYEQLKAEGKLDQRDVKDYEVEEFTESERAAVDLVVRDLCTLGYDSITTYNITKGRFIRADFEQIVAMAEFPDNIILSASAFQNKDHPLRMVIFEEFMHLYYNVSDCSRGMQNRLFQEWNHLASKIIRDR